VVKKRHTGTVPAAVRAQALKLSTGPHEREVERAGIEAGDLVAVGGHEEVAEAGVEILDDRNGDGCRRWRWIPARERLQVGGDRHQVGVVEDARLVHRTHLDPHLGDRHDRLQDDGPVLAVQDAVVVIAGEAVAARAIVVVELLPALRERARRGEREEGDEQGSQQGHRGRPARRTAGRRRPFRAARVARYGGAQNATPSGDQFCNVVNAW
jgi:hypothetical protein